MLFPRGFNPAFAIRPILPAILILTAAAPITSVSSSSLKSARARPPLQLRRMHPDGSADSTNWAGYAALGDNVTDARGSWIVPSVTCKASAKDHLAAFWVGIDGYSSNTVEQIGTDSDCSSGTPTYYAWFEFYPQPFYTVTNVSVNPGDRIRGEVSYNAVTSLFTVSLRNETTGQAFSVSSALPKAKRSSAEWITEKSGGPLSHFGTVYYGKDYTGIDATCDADVNGQTGDIGAFGPNISKITMVRSDDTIIASPSGLSPNGSSFSVTRE